MKMGKFFKIIAVVIYLNCSSNVFGQVAENQKTIMDVEIAFFKNKIVFKNISIDKRVVKTMEIIDNKIVSSGVINCESQKENTYVFKNEKSRVEIDILESYGKGKNISFKYVVRE